MMRKPQGLMGPHLLQGQIRKPAVFQIVGWAMIFSETSRSPRHPYVTRYNFTWVIRLKFHVVFPGFSVKLFVTDP